MHELSIALSMIDEIADRIPSQRESTGQSDIEAVHLKLGVFSGVDKDALLFAWELACEDTPLHGSRLIIETVPLILYCESCRRNRTPPSLYDLMCPACRSPSQTIVSGREIEVAYLEVAA